MTNKITHLGPLVRIDVLRPNGVVLSSEEHAFSTSLTIERRCNELRAACRNERGWTPTFRILETKRACTPWETADVTANYRV